MREKLTNISIMQACEEAESYLKKRGCESKELIRIKLSVEEVLLFYQQLLGEEAEYVLETGAGFGRSKIRLTIPGEESDPFSDSSSFSDEDAFIRNALNQMGRLPKWNYRRGKNEIIFTAEKKKLPEWTKLVIATAAAVLSGFIVRILPAELGILLRDGVITPLINTFLGFLNAVAGPMIFLSVVWGIFSIGDTATFSEVGKLLSKKAGLFLVGLTTVIAIVSMPFFTLNFGEGKTGSDLTSLYQMVLDIVPSNLFTPFSRGNTLQILFVAVIIGIAMLLLGKTTQAIADLTEQLGLIVNGIMNVVSGLVPLFVFGSLFIIVVSSDFYKLAAGAKFFLATAAGCVLLLLLSTLVVCVRCRLSPVKLWQNSLSTFLIAITTASSSAAFSDNLQSCIEKHGVNKRIASFGVPFGQILYKPAVVVLYWISVISTAESEHVEVSAAWIITALFICIVLSTAAAPVPGGMSASFTILFAQLGLPAAELAIILSLTSVLDFIVTATNLFSGQCLLIAASNSFDKET